MTFFESLLALLLVAIVLLQVSRRLAIPYPAMLALAGVIVAFVPGSPTIGIDPGTALALFIAPVLLDAAYDFPVRAARVLWRPLAVLAVGAVLVTTAAVAWIGVAYAGLPIAAAIVLGAIVSPPDAAAATAALASVSLPKRTLAVLRGESLFNDATALILFGGALAVQANGGFGPGVALRLALAAPGGIAFGIAAAWVVRKLGRFVMDSLGGNIFQFVMAFAVWIVAEHLHLSPVLAIVGFAMTIARSVTANSSPRMRVHSFAVWSTVVFLLNVLAFLLMGMQARTIVERMTPAHFSDALDLAGLVIAAIVASRFALAMGWNRLAAWSESLRGDLPAPTTAQGVFVSWCGMRGLLTLATAFALPAGFPQRDVIVLVAFGVVLATLIGQGLTMTPLVRLLKLDRLEDPDRDVAEARDTLARAASAALAEIGGPEADHVRFGYDVESGSEPGERYRHAGMAAVAAERALLETLRSNLDVGDDTYYRLQEELDWRELTFLPESERRIEEA